MPSVDERVVELQFDNGDFSQRVDSTISELHRLESALQMSGSASGIQEVNNAIGRMNVNPMLDAAESVANKFSIMRTVAVSAINRITNSVMDLGNRLVGFVPGQIMSGGWNRAMNIAKSEFTLEGILREGDSLEDISEKISESVTGTAYAYDEASMAASSFYASGITDTDQLFRALRATAGVAAMTNSEYSDIARIFTTISGNGKVMSQQLNQIAGRGLNAAAALAEYFQVSEAEIREAVTDGEITFEMFSEAMFEKFGEHAAKANETYMGALANMKGAFSRIGAEFATPLIDGLVPVINKIREMVLAVKTQTDKLVAPFSKLVDVGKEFATRVFGNLQEFFASDEFGRRVDKLADKLSGFVDVLDKEFNPDKSLGAEEWSKLADAPYADILKEKLIETASAADEGFKDMYDSYENFEDSLSSGWLTKDIFATAVGDLKDTAGALDEVANSAEDAEKYLEEMWGYAFEVERGDWGNGQERIDRLTEAGLSYHDIQGLVNHDLLGWDYTLEGLNQTLRESGKYTDEQIEAIEAFAKELDNGGSSLNEFMALFDSVDKMSTFELVTGGLVNVLRFLQEILIDVFAAFMSVFHGEEFVSVGDVVHDAAAAFYLWSESLDGFGKNGRTVVNVAKKIFNFIKNGINFVLDLKDAFIAVGEIMLPVFAPFGDLLKYIIDKIRDLTDKVSGAKTTFRGFEGILGLIVSAFQSLSDFLAPLVQSFVDWVIAGDYVGKALDFIATSFEAIKPVLKGVGDALLGAFTTAAPYIIDFAQTIPDRIVSAFEFIRDKITPILSTVGDALSNVFGKSIGNTDLGGAFTGFFDALSSGEGILDSFVTLVTEGFSTAFDVIKEFVDFIGTAFTDIFSATDSGGSAQALDETAESIDNVNQKMSDLSKTAGSFKDVFGWFIDIFFDLNDTINNLFECLRLLSDFMTHMDLETFDKLFGYGIQIGNFVLFYNIFKSISDLAGGFKGFTEALGGFTDALSPVSKAIEAARPSKFFEFALAIAAVALSVWLLAQIPVDQLRWAVAELVICIGVMVLAMKGMSTIASSMKPADAKNLLIVGETMLILAGAILLVAAACYIMQYVDPLSMAKTGIILLALIQSIRLMSGEKLTRDMTGVAISLLALGAAMLILALAVYIFGSIPFDTFVQGMVGVVGCLLAMGVAMKLASSVNTKGLAVAFIGLAVAVGILAIAVNMLGQMTWDAMIQGLVGVGIAMVFLSSALVGLSLFFKETPMEAAMLISIGAAFALMGVGILACAVAVQILASLVDNGLWQAIGAFIVITAVLVAAIAIISLVAPAFAAAGAGMLLFGQGLALVGVGALLLAVSLGVLAVTLPLLGAGLSMFAESAARSARDLGEGLAAGLQAFLDVVSEQSGPVTKSMGNAATSMFSGFADAIGENVPIILGKAVELFTNLVDSVVPYIPQFLQKGVELVQALLQGLGEQAPNLASSAIQLAEDLINALAEALDGAGPGLRAACDNLVSSMINFIVEFITGKSQDVGDSGETIGDSVVQGIHDGIEKVIDIVTGPIREVVENIINTAKSLLGIASPSTIFDSIGQDIINGLVQGIKALANSPIEAFEFVINGIKDLFANSPLGPVFDTFTTGVTDAFNKVKEDPAKAIEEGFGFVKDKVTDVGGKIVNVGSETMSDFASAFDEGKTKVTNLANGIVTDVKSKVEPLKTDMKSAASEGASNFVSAISAKTAAAKTAGSNLVNAVANSTKTLPPFMKAAGSQAGANFATGIRSAVGSARSASSSVASGARSGVSGVSFYSAGTNAIQGFINGMRAMYGSASYAASQIGSGALAALKRSLHEKSPSTLADQYGRYMVMGLINGIVALKRSSEIAAEDLGESTISKLSGINEAVVAMADQEFDFNPTITPIVDMENVKSATGAIDSMLGNAYGLGLGGTLGGYNLYGNNGVADNSKSIVYNVSVSLDYQAGAEPNGMAEDLASALRTKLNLEG